MDLAFFEAHILSKYNFLFFYNVAILGTREIIIKSINMGFIVYVLLSTYVPTNVPHPMVI